MSGVFITCCVRGMEVTRHYTNWQASQILLIAAFAMTVAGLLLTVGTLLKAWRGRG
jgi:hypothetical protein